MPNTRWKLILHGPGRGDYNMAVDEVLLHSLEPPLSAPTTLVRFYQWRSPTISLGFSQKEDKVIDFDFCRKHEIEVVRRITGGKAVLHHHEITYAVISNDVQFFPRSDVIGTYQRIAAGLQAGFQKLGVNTELASSPRTLQTSARTGAIVSCFALSNHYEILCRGKKLVGSAQRRLPCAFLQHGSILLEYDGELWNKVFTSPADEIKEQRVADLNHCLENPLSKEEIINCLLAGFSSCFQVDFESFVLNPRMETEVRRLQPAKNVTYS
jgi:lipoate-protein ligase A